MRLIDMFDALRHVGPGAVESLVISLLPLTLAVFYARRPAEHLLAFMRPLSLAAIFGALGALIGGIATVLRGIGATGQFTAHSFNLIALGMSATLMPPFVCFGSLAIAWLLVALGMRRAERAV